MKGDKLVFTHRSEMAQLELPPGTVLEVELVQELEREVCRIIWWGLRGESIMHDIDREKTFRITAPTDPTKSSN